MSLLNKEITFNNFIVLRRTLISSTGNDITATEIRYTAFFAVFNFLPDRSVYEYYYNQLCNNIVKIRKFLDTMFLFKLVLRSSV